MRFFEYRYLVRKLTVANSKYVISDLRFIKIRERHLFLYF